MTPRKQNLNNSILDEKPEITLNLSQEEPENQEEPTQQSIEKLEKENDNNPISLSKIGGIGSTYKRILKEQGINSVQELLEADSDDLSKETRFSAEKIQEWQNKGRKLLEKSEESGKRDTTEEDRRANAHNNNDKLKENVRKIKEKEGIIGYISRDSTSASIDLNDPTKVIDYAILSSSTLEASQELSRIFTLGEVTNILVEGNTAKLFSFHIKENKISVFMEKQINHNRIHKDLVS
jgi:predicted flap endonuclease-1-like 5' DNA nuclease